MASDLGNERIGGKAENPLKKNKKLQCPCCSSKIKAEKLRKHIIQVHSRQLEQQGIQVSDLL